MSWWTDPIKIRVTVYGILLILVAFTYTVFSVLLIEEAKSAPPKIQEVWTGPEIPQCNKELWLRIKDGCP